MHDDIYAERTLPDGRVCVVFPLTFGRARIGVGSHLSPLLFDSSY